MSCVEVPNTKTVPHRKSHDPMTSTSCLHASVHDIMGAEGVINMTGEKSFGASNEVNRIDTFANSKWNKTIISIITTILKMVQCSSILKVFIWMSGNVFHTKSYNPTASMFCFYKLDPTSALN